MRTPIAAFFSPQFIKFCVVGGLGLVTDQTIFFFVSRLVDSTSVFVNFIWLIGYSVAVLQNYLINHYWTFRDETRETPASGKGFASFFLISVAALLPRFLAYKTVILLLGTTSVVLNVANICGIVTGTAVNFLGSKFLVFKRKEHAIL